MTPSNTGSRNGIITWAVIATLLGLATMIWAFLSFTKANKLQDEITTLNGKYKAIGSLSGDAYAAFNTIRERPGQSASTPLLDVAANVKNDLTSLIGGASVSDDAKATTDAQAAMAKAKETVGTSATLDTTSLTAAITGLTRHVGTLQSQNTQLTDQLKAATDRAVAAESAKAQVVAASDQKVAELTEQANASQADAAAYRKTIDEQLTGVQGQLSTNQSNAVRSTNDLNNRIADLQQQMAAKDRELTGLRDQLKQFRVPTNQIAQQADGVISRIADDQTVFINLGSGQQIAAGMTFEVYDKLGMPRVTSEDASQDALLKGKASIEVVKVQQGISQCRVVRQSPGQAVTEGDPIVNVVYNKDVKFNFYVFGKFNLDYRGEPTDADADVVRRLISRWGAQVTDALDSKTDFLILGDEPVVPAYTQDELGREPEKAFQKEQAEQALEQYQDLRNRANQLNIPILNQTRFLYMIGYYEEAAR